ncbi:MAG TPA: hypothetical protein VGK19_02645 [Capsulimonadaceae bacterium]|jgi:hypothetical protein
METSEYMEPLQEGALNGPSAEFINAVSEFLDTDPTDLLVELGYYETSSTPAIIAEPATAQR